jgi:hypothetical protein
MLHGTDCVSAQRSAPDDERAGDRSGNCPLFSRMRSDAFVPEPPTARRVEHGGGTKAHLCEFRHTLRWTSPQLSSSVARALAPLQPRELNIKMYGWPCVTTTAPLRLATAADNAVSLERLAMRDLFILHRVRGRRCRGHARSPLARERKLLERVHRSADMIEQRPDLHSALHGLCGTA